VASTSTTSGRRASPSTAASFRRRRRLRPRARGGRSRSRRRAPSRTSRRCSEGSCWTGAPTGPTGRSLASTTPCTIRRSSEIVHVRRPNGPPSSRQHRSLPTTSLWWPSRSPWQSVRTPSPLQCRSGSRHRNLPQPSPLRRQCRPRSPNMPTLYPLWRRYRPRSPNMPTLYPLWRRYRPRSPNMPTLSPLWRRHRPRRSNLPPPLAKRLTPQRRRHLNGGARSRRRNATRRQLHRPWKIVPPHRRLHPGRPQLTPRPQPRPLAH
jgi:hypothetical protein